jgi:hypothetical protein
MNSPNTLSVSPRRVDGQEVAGQDLVSVLVDELAPGVG